MNSGERIHRYIGNILATTENQFFKVFINDENEIQDLWFCSLDEARDRANTLAKSSADFISVTDVRGEVVHTAYECKEID